MSDDSEDWVEPSYVDIHSNRSCLDGWFTAEELRKIADEMDQLKESQSAETE